MKKSYYKLCSIAVIFGITLIFAGHLSEKASGMPTGQPFQASPAIEKPLPTVTPTPGITPQDDFPDKKKVG